MLADKTALVLCPMCWAENSSDAERCFLCHQSLVGAESMVPKKSGDLAQSAPHRPSFHLSALMLMIALIAVFLGVAHEAPRVAVVLAVPGAIALISTVRSAVRNEGFHSWFDHLAVFAATFIVVVGVAFASFVAFFVTCLPFVAVGGLNGLGVGFLIGGTAGVAVAVWLTVAFNRGNRRRWDG